MTSVNWNDLQKAAGEAGFDPVPAGTYDVIIDNAAAKPTNTGKQMVAVQFKVESGPYAGKVIFNQFVLSPENPNALAFFFRHMNAIGLSSEYFSTNPPLERVAADLTGRRCRVSVSIRRWNDTDRNNVDAVAPPLGGPAASPPPPPPGSAPAPSVTPAPSTSSSPAPAPAPPVPPAASPSSAPATPPPPSLDELPF